MKFAVSSHVSYHAKTFDPFVQSMLASGVPADDIYFFIGGSDTTTYKEMRTTFDGVHAYLAPHNSMDFTGLVSVLELNIESDGWFAMHDTTRVGPAFYDVVSKRLPESTTIALTSDGPSMNMGAYAWSYLKSHRDDIIARFKNVDISPEGTQRIKKMNVETEDALLIRGEAYNRSARVSSGPTDYYGSGTARIVEYFPDVDVYKIKANWFPKDTYAVIT